MRLFLSCDPDTLLFNFENIVCALFVYLVTPKDPDHLRSYCCNVLFVQLYVCIYLCALGKVFGVLLLVAVLLMPKPDLIL